MKDVYQEEKQQLDALLRLDSSFDLTAKEMIIGGKRAALYFVDGFAKDEMMEKVKSNGIEDRVVNLGRRDDIKQFYNSFDTFLLPSLYEGMPVVGIEAQCAGLPIFFSKNITEETTASDLAHYISLDSSAEYWAKEIVSIMKNNQSDRANAFKQVIASGFDSKNEAMRLQKYYEERISK